MKTIIDWDNEATVADLLSADAFEEQLTTFFDGSSTEVDVIDRRQFFDDMYAPVVSGKLFRTSRGIRTKIDYDEWIDHLKCAHNSELNFVEGYAGCGKSTFVQRVLYDILEDTNYDYNYYNYNIGAYIGENKANRIADAIVSCSLRQMAIAIKKGHDIVIERFRDLLSKPEIQFFDSDNTLYSIFTGEMFRCSYNELKSGLIDENIFSKKFGVAFQKVNLYRILAMDHLFRIANYICGGYARDKKRVICLCYDNLDAIENFDLLKDFDNSLFSILANLDDFLLASREQFRAASVPVPRFITFATYRKITVARVELNKSHELLDDQSKDFIFYIDASELFDFKDIVYKKYAFFSSFFKYRHINAARILNELRICVDLFKMDFMNRNYSGLWNHNYRSCADFINSLLINYKGEVIRAIELQKKNDGYEESNDYSFNYGASALFLHLICKLFMRHGLWDNDHLALIDITKDDKISETNELTSLSRLILTYVLNIYESELRAVSTRELFEHFSSMYSKKELCNCLFNMLFRGDPVIWRRPLFYWRNAINENESIKDSLEKQWDKYIAGIIEKQEYTELMISSCGKAFINCVSTQFEFYSVRGHGKKSLYFTNNVKEICNIIENVRKSVLRCCEKMKRFNSLYVNANCIDYKQFNSDNIHPRTRGGKPQQHIERMIFAHIFYINRRRMDLLETYSRKQSSKNRKTINEKKAVANAQLLDQLEGYLDLYMNYIKEYDSQRLDIAEELMRKVHDSQTSDDDRIKYQSISLS